MSFRDPIPGAHRVLMATGAVSANALGDPDGERARLEAEGLRFVDDRADRHARMHVDELLGQRG